MLNFREGLINQLRKNYNDLIMLQTNLMIPDDLDRGPTASMIKIDDIIIPKYVSVFEIPENLDGVSDLRKSYFTVLEECTSIRNLLEKVDFINDTLIYTESDLYGNELDKNLNLLAESYQVIRNIEALIPDNFNMYLTRYFEYKNALLLMIHPLLKKLRDYVNAYSVYLEGTIVEDTDKWLEEYDSYFEDGMYCANFDNNVKVSMNQGFALLTKYQAVVAHLCANNIPNSPNPDMMQCLDTAISKSMQVLSKNYHLERSKCKLTEWHNWSKPAVVESILPKLPYDYVHERYSVEYLNEMLKKEAEANMVIEDSPHLNEHSSDHRVGHIGDIITDINCQ